MEKITLSADDAKQKIIQCLTAHDTSLENAESTARYLIDADLHGIGSHGLARTVAYAKQAKSGKVKGMISPTYDINGGRLSIDAQNGFAYPALDLGIKLLPDLAQKNGIAMATIKNSHHCGMLGSTLRQLAEKGVIAFMFTNAPASMAAWGGKRAIFGTNPIGFTAPRKDGKSPVIVDMSTSLVARGKIMRAAQDNTPIPQGWALDESGNPTTNAKAALTGTMLPMGEAKGYGLALMVEILAAALTGSNPSTHASSFFNDQGPSPGIGQTIIVIHPRGHYFDLIEQLIENLHEDEGVRIPGEGHPVKKEQALKQGITYPKHIVEEVCKLS